MRLLHVGDLSLAEFVGNDIPRYAILSHTWGADHEEVTFKDMVDGTGNAKAGYRKIRLCEKLAAKDGLQFFWVDTCCIDKSNYTELAEAINSMFRWYQDAARCYVYLSDVSAGGSIGDDEFACRWKTAFKKSRWFTRGWTLQELIAPVSVEFFSVEGERLGDKKSLEQTLHELTGIATQALRGSPLSYFSTDERMSWAAKRRTKREEDSAYSLLGIFNIYMPLIYGEGRQKALSRLLKEIKDDNSISLPIAKGASFDSHTEEHNARCLRNTRVELLSQITEWAKDRNDKPIFWLQGMAGTGKSTIARSAAQSFAYKGQLGASFFFKRGEGDRGKAARFFTTIAVQLATKVPGLSPYIREAIDADPDISEKALNNQFEKFILQPLFRLQPVSLQASSLVIVVDALDECEREEDVRTILRLLPRSRDVTSVCLRIFVTSRPELPIRLGFKKMTGGTYQDLVLHEIPPTIIKHDISVFLNHELTKIRIDRSLLADWPGEKNIQTLVELATPLFIFAATMCRFVADPRWDPRKRLAHILEYQTASQASKLDRTYLPILNQLLVDQDEVEKEKLAIDFQEIVGTIAVLASPLSIISLASLLGIPEDDVARRLDLLHSVLSIPTNRAAPVRLLHLSFRDFLLDRQKREKSLFWVDERKTHERIAGKCIQLMSISKCLRKNICNLQGPGMFQSEIDSQFIDVCLPAEVRYACRYWVYHLEQSKSGICDNGQVHVFLRDHLLHWLEAMSLLGNLSESITIITTLQSILEADKSTELFDFIHDAKRFVLYNRSVIEQAPLQTYCSALIFTPGESIVRKQFENHIPSWIRKKPRVQAKWNATLQTLEGHSDEVNSVAFSPDGKLVASGSDDRIVKLWDTSTGVQLQTLEGHSGWVNSVAFSRDAKLVASGSADKTVRVWDTSTGVQLQTLEGHSGRVNSVAFSPDGKLVASGSWDETVRLWDTSTGVQLPTLEGHSDEVNSVALSPDGKLVASGSNDKTVRLWDTSTGVQLQTLEGHSGRVYSVAFSRDGKLVASGSYDKTVRLWDAVTGAALQMLELGITTGTLSFSTSGQYLITGRGALGVSSLKLSPDPLEQLRALFVSNDWVAEEGANILWLPPDYRATCVAVRDGMVVLGHSSGAILCIDPLSALSLALHRHDRSVTISDSQNKAHTFHESAQSLFRVLDTSSPITVLDRIGSKSLQDHALDLVLALQALPAFRLLPSNGGCVIPLLIAVLGDKSDDIIWDKVYEIVAESALITVAKPSTPPPSSSPQIASFQTPWMFNTGSFADTSDLRRNVEPVE
ncbi:MAG: hypothetical protein M1839_003847 [Geoglossum umbratile]|nr:MAG: hypothetical protein M1839_003847 [Geoglossum umbratile]